MAEPVKESLDFDAPLLTDHTKRANGKAQEPVDEDKKGKKEKDKKQKEKDKNKYKQKKGDGKRSKEPVSIVIKTDHSGLHPIIIQHKSPLSSPTTVRSTKQGHGGLSSPKGGRPPSPHGYPGFAGLPSSISNVPTIISPGTHSGISSLPHTPIRSPQFQQHVTEHLQHEHSGASCTLLPPPSITYEVATAPSSPTDSIIMHDMRLSSSSQHLDNTTKGTSMTPSGSLLAVNKPIELRESTLTVNYPDTGGMYCLVHMIHK